MMARKRGKKFLLSQMFPSPVLSLRFRGPLRQRKGKGGKGEPKMRGARGPLISFSNSGDCAHRRRKRRNPPLNSYCPLHHYCTRNPCDIISPAKGREREKKREKKKKAIVVEQSHFVRSMSRWSASWWVEEKGGGGKKIGFLSVNNLTIVPPSRAEARRGEGRKGNYV